MCSDLQVWEVSAQLLGLAGSVSLLKAIEATGKPENVLGVWAIVQVHFLANYLHELPWLLGFCWLCAWRPEVLSAGMCTQVLHALLRYKSLAVLQFPSINQKRACLLAAAHVAGQPLPGHAQSWLFE